MEETPRAGVPTLGRELHQETSGAVRGAGPTGTVGGLACVGGGDGREQRWELKAPGRCTGMRMARNWPLRRQVQEGAGQVSGPSSGARGLASEAGWGAC